MKKSFSVLAPYPLVYCDPQQIPAWSSTSSCLSFMLSQCDKMPSSIVAYKSKARTPVPSEEGPHRTSILPIWHHSELCSLDSAL